MIALAIRFPAGRFHATPWGRHVNEAAPEWPPSPWRLLRALVATWKRKLARDPACDSEIVESLLRKLADPPNYALPPASTGHTRHYMPWYKKGPTMVFDAFVALEKHEEVLAQWPKVILDDRERVALERLAANLGFLGRAESWVEARVMPNEETVETQARINCVPISEGLASPPGIEPVRVLCADATTAFDNQYTPTEGRGRAKRTTDTPIYEPDWHLCVETLELHQRRWSDPPGSRWETYLRRRDCFAVEPWTARPRTKGSTPTVARFALDGTVLPLVRDTLRIAEMARIVAMGCHRRIEEWRRYGGPAPNGVALPRSPVLSGKDADGRALAGHGHAFYLPSDEDGDGRIDHLTIVATMGFGQSEVKAFDRMRRIPRDDGDPVNLLLLGLGRETDIAAPMILGRAQAWISATPFIVTRHSKSRGTKRDSPELLGLHNQRAFARQVLIEEISRLRERRPEILEPLQVEHLNAEHRCGVHNLRPIQFQRFRRKRSDDGGRRPAGAFRIVFPEPVPGPICLGHSSHFGMGLFVPEEG